MLDFDGDVLGQVIEADHSNEVASERLQNNPQSGSQLGPDCVHAGMSANQPQEDSDGEEMCIDNDDSDDDPEADTLHMHTAGVQATVVQHHSAACIGKVDPSATCELYYIDMVLDWTGDKHTFQCIAKRVDFIYLGVNSSGFGEMHKCGSVTCGACIVAQDSEKVETWDELIVSTPWARTARALLVLLRGKFDYQDRTSFMRSCVDLEIAEVTHLLSLHAVEILPAKTLATKPILEAIQSIFRAQLATLPQSRA